MALSLSLQTTSMKETEPMLQSWLRPRRAPHKRPATFRPTLESLSDRIVPTIGNGAHFLFATSSVTAGGDLVINFKEAGLGNIDESVPIRVTGTASATYQWFNHGGNRPQGVPFSVSEAIDVTLSFPVQNGQVTGTFTIAAPPPPADFLTHPHADSWIAKFTVSYTNIALTSFQGTTVTATTAGEFNLDQSVTSPIVV
jgi:hypothetical protein